MKYDERARKFNMDTGCVGAAAPGWEKDFHRLHRGRGLELDYLIYNDPLGYADLILNGEPEEYLKNAAGNHGLED